MPFFRSKIHQPRSSPASEIGAGGSERSRKKLRTARIRSLSTPFLSPSQLEPQTPHGTANLVLDPHAYYFTAILIDAAEQRATDVIHAPTSISGASYASRPLLQHAMSLLERHCSVSKSKYPTPGVSSYHEDRNRDHRHGVDEVREHACDALLVNATRRTLLGLSSVPEADEGEATLTRSMTISENLSSLALGKARKKQPDAEYGHRRPLDKPLPALPPRVPPNTPAGSLRRAQAYRGPDGLGSLVGMSAAIMEELEVAVVNGRGNLMSDSVTI